MQATLITIGDEILIGQTLDTNSANMAKYLEDIGIKVYEMLSVSDMANHIKDALDRALASSQIVLITGGLGPTKDDITKKTLADYFGTQLVLVPELLQALESYFVKRGRPFLESTKSLAMIPESCEMIRNRKGTAAAMWFEENGKIVVSMPGIPYEMKDFMEYAVIPRFQEKFNLPTIIHKKVKAIGAGETVIASKIEKVSDALPPYIKLAFLPHFGVTTLRLTARGNDATQLKEEVGKYAQEMQALLTPKFYMGEDEASLSGVIGKLLLEKNAMLGIAESCTGGMIAQRITALAGSSRYFQGGVVAYSNKLKNKLLGVENTTLETHGAVSEETVIEMAQGTIERLDCDYAVAVSGIAGPGGGTPEKPVGLIWIAVADKSSVYAKRYQFTRTRSLNIELSTTIGLNQLRKLMLGVL